MKPVKRFVVESGRVSERVVYCASDTVFVRKRRKSGAMYVVELSKDQVFKTRTEAAAAVSGVNGFGVCRHDGPELVRVKKVAGTYNEFVHADTGATLWLGVERWFPTKRAALTPAHLSAVHTLTTGELLAAVFAITFVSFACIFVAVRMRADLRGRS